MKAGRISSISQYFETAARSSGSSTPFGPDAPSGRNENALLSKTSTTYFAPGAAARRAEDR